MHRGGAVTNYTAIKGGRNTMSNLRFKVRDNLKNLYDVSDVTEGYNYWVWKLLNICLDIFDYENLPATLPAREIESNLMLTGHCFIFPHKGELITSVTSIYGFDKYYNPTKATYAQAVIGSRSNINIEDYAIIYNSSLKDNVLNIPSDGSLLTFIQRYARQLADMESTINSYIAINMRLTSLPVGTNDNIKGSLRRFFDMLRLGKREVIVDTPIIESFRMVDFSTNKTNDTLTDMLQCRDKILEMFYRDIGVKFRNNKRANMTESEVESDNQVLLISLDDMLKQREAGIEEVNNKYGTNIKVAINDRFKVKEVVDNDTERVPTE